MPAASMTYTELVAQIKAYCERPNDAALAAQIPMLILIAENKLAAAVKNLGIQQVAVSNLVAGTTSFAKPAYWRDSVSFRLYTPITGKQLPVFLRSYEFCRAYWPISSQLATPKYYADYNYENFLVAPTPDLAYLFELLYHPRLTPLSDEAQVNWFTENAPQLLLYGCMVEAQTWLKNFDKVATWSGLYDGAIAALAAEDNARLADRDTVVR